MHKLSLQKSYCKLSLYIILDWAVQEKYFVSSVFILPTLCVTCWECDLQVQKNTMWLGLFLEKSASNAVLRRLNRPISLSFIHSSILQNCSIN
jgi:hypothetical protein